MELRIVNNNIEIDGEPVARILDIRPTLRDTLENFINKHEDHEAKIEQLMDTCHELQDELAELKLREDDDAR